MAKATITISEKAHEKLLKIQLERKLKGEKNVSIVKLSEEYLDKGLGVK